MCGSATRFPRVETGAWWTSPTVDADPVASWSTTFVWCFGAGTMRVYSRHVLAEPPQRAEVASRETSIGYRWR